MEAITSREIILFNFLQVWDLMLVGFLFFQTFKYVRMPKSFYLQRQYETRKYFKYLGVNIFRFLLINSFFRHLNNRVYLKGKAKDYLLTFIEETKQSETSHIISGIFPLSIQLLYLKNGLIEHFIWLSIFNIILNLYPLLLQRMNRFNMFAKYPNLTEKN
tara:strand:- start:444 stop:923 length:480 start_codon:yes stop_codon:yes gene_type:complete